MFIGTITTAEGVEQVVRARTLGQAIDFAMDTSKRRACAKIEIFAKNDPTLGDQFMCTVAFAGRGLLFTADIDTRDGDKPVLVEAEAEAPAA